MKILVVLPRFPYPLEKGDKLRAYNQIVELSKHHTVSLFCLSHQRVSEEQISALRPYCADIRVVHLNRIVCYCHVVRNWFTARSLQIGYWQTSRARHAYRSFERKIQPDIVYNQMVRTMYLVSRSKYPKVMDFQDALSMNTERRMDHSRGLWRHILHYEFKMLRAAEYKAFSIFDALTIISETDADAIPHKRNLDIAIVPNGVDFDHFTPLMKVDSGECVVDSSRGQVLPTNHYPLPTHFDICFCGNMAYAPNVNASNYLVSQVMPLVWQRRPQTTVLLAGASPKHSVSRLAAADRRVTVSGSLPDIRAAYAASSIFVAPMQIGSGLQNKLLEAMSMQLPCVTTSIANAALGAQPGTHILVADTPQSLADAILDLLQDPQLSSSIAQQGNTFVRQHFGWPQAVAKLETILNEVLESKQTR